MDPVILGMLADKRKRLLKQYKKILSHDAALRRSHDTFQWSLSTVSNHLGAASNFCISNGLDYSESESFVNELSPKHIAKF